MLKWALKHSLIREPHCMVNSFRFLDTGFSVLVVQAVLEFLRYRILLFFVNVGGYWRHKACLKPRCLGYVHVDDIPT